MKKMALMGAVAGLLWAGQGFADITGTWATGQEGTQVVVKYRDANNFRVEMSPEAYQLATKGELYMVTRDGNDVTAMKMGDMSAMLRGMGGKPSAQKPDPEPTLKDTGRTETIAGLKGKVYEATIKTDEGTHVEEMVLSKDPVAIELQTAMLAYAQKMAKTMFGAQNPMPGGSSSAKMVKDMGGVLRYGKDWKLQSYDRGKVKDSELTLPANAQVVTMPAMPQMGPGGRR